MGDHLASTIFFSLVEMLGKLGKFASSTGISKKNWPERNKRHLPADVKFDCKHRP